MQTKLYITPTFLGIQIKFTFPCCLLMPFCINCQELETQLAAKEVSLPPEPASGDDNAVNLLVKMPDGSRRGRRFLRSDKLQVKMRVTKYAVFTPLFKCILVKLSLLLEIFSLFSTTSILVDR